MKHLRPFLFLLFASLAGLAFFVARSDANPETIKRIAPGVYFREGDLEQGHCNNVIIEMKDYLIVVDANYPSGARAARKVGVHHNQVILHLDDDVVAVAQVLQIALAKPDARQDRLYGFGLGVCAHDKQGRGHQHGEKRTQDYTSHREQSTMDGPALDGPARLGLLPRGHRMLRPAFGRAHDSPLDAHWMVIPKTTFACTPLPPDRKHEAGRGKRAPERPGSGN